MLLAFFTEKVLAKHFLKKSVIKKHTFFLNVFDKTYVFFNKDILIFLFYYF